MMTHDKVDNYSVAVGDEVFRDETLLFAGEDTLLKGTLLSRKTVSDSITETPDGGNTGDYTLVATARPSKTLKVGTYVLTAGDLTAGVGPWTLTDPEGATETFTTSAAGDDLVFDELGMDVAVTVVTTAFDDGDTADIVVAAQSGTPLVPFSPTGSNGEDVPVAVLTYEAYRATAGNLAIRPLVSGKVRKNRLVIHADGDDSNITEVILDKLRSAKIDALNSQQLLGYDNE